MNALHRIQPSGDSIPAWNDFIEQQKTDFLRKSDHRSAIGSVRESHWEDSLLAPVREILSRPGKAIRASLVEAGYELIRPGETPPPAAVALVEILHAGSLIVDDIEDDSPVRRGGKAVHRIFGLVCVRGHHPGEDGSLGDACAGTNHASPTPRAKPAVARPRGMRRTLSGSSV